MSAPDGFLAGAATGAAPGTARTVVPARSGPSNSSVASDFSRDTPFPDGGGLSAPGHVDGTSPLLRSGGFRPKSGSWQKNRLIVHWAGGLLSMAQTERRPEEATSGS